MSNVIRKCIECKRDKKVELERLYHGWFCVRCARTRIFRSSRKGGVR